MKTLVEIDLSDVTRDAIGAELLKITDHTDPDRTSASLYQAFALLPIDELCDRLLTLIPDNSTDDIVLLAVEVLP